MLVFSCWLLVCGYWYVVGLSLTISNWCVCSYVLLCHDIQMDIYDAAERYKLEGRSIVVIAGKDYGSGSSRDWVAKGPWLLVS